MNEFFASVPDKHCLHYFQSSTLKQLVSYLGFKMTTTFYFYLYFIISDSSTNNSVTDNIQTCDSVADLPPDDITNDQNNDEAK